MHQAVYQQYTMTQLGYYRYHWTNDPYTCVDGARRRLSLPYVRWPYSKDHCTALCTISGMLLTQCQHSIGIFQPETWGSRLTDTCLPGTCSIISKPHMRLHMQVGQKYTTVQFKTSIWLLSSYCTPGHLTSISMETKYQHYSIYEDLSTEHTTQISSTSHNLTNRQSWCLRGTSRWSY